VFYHRREELKEKREKDRIKKERENQKRYEQQLEIERRKASEAQALIEKMEREEIDLIENLKATQKLQEEAYLKLQHSLETEDDV
jgi:hypothetical protein